MVLGLSSVFTFTGDAVKEGGERVQVTNTPGINYPIRKVSISRHGRDF